MVLEKIKLTIILEKNNWKSHPLEFKHLEVTA